jgi:UDP-2-acetamido-2-deoxy-ribo-hexuluronate aminotransferase
MQFNDLTTQQDRIKEKLDKNIQSVMKHGQYIMGPEVKELEKRLSDYVGVKHGIACSSGTDALLLALMAYGVGPGDAIFTTPFTFIATAEVISLLGATPVFVDIDPNTFNIDPVQLEKAISALKSNDSSAYPLPNQQLHHSANQPFTLMPKGIIPVDLFGLPAEYDRINVIAKKHNLFVIEDAAQSFGAEYKGKKSCSLADVACTSFFPAKPLGCYGDGGMCFTDDDKIAVIMRSLLVHGKGTDKYDNVRIGINGRLDTLQAAILNAKFDIFPEEVELRDKVAQRYNNFLSTLTLQLSTPQVPLGLRSVWAQYSILAKDENHRAALQKKLQDNKIPTAIYYPTPLHLQTAFAPLGYTTGNFPISENAASRIFSLPMHPYLIEQDQQQIVSIIKS